MKRRRAVRVGLIAVVASGLAGDAAGATGLRQAEGADDRHHFGLSYGSALGASYASMFPERTDRVVLDSNIGNSVSDRESIRQLERQPERQPGPSGLGPEAASDAASDKDDAKAELSSTGSCSRCSALPARTFRRAPTGPTSWRNRRSRSPTRVRRTC